jgi:hypothetical protein
MGDEEGAAQEFNWVLAEQPDHFGSTIHRAWMNDLSHYTSLKLLEKKDE